MTRNFSHKTLSLVIRRHFHAIYDSDVEQPTMLVRFHAHLLKTTQILEDDLMNLLHARVHY